MRARCVVPLAITMALLCSDAALAASNCTFRSAGRALSLQGDCWTDATLTIPEGVTLDGRGHTVTALDPEAGHFVGAVVRNEGRVAHVRNLTIDTRALADVCDSDGPPDQRLRGILFEGASGSITNNRLSNIAQPGSGCQEGNAIEVRGAQGAPLRVAIVGNRIAGYQKTGVLVTGAVDVDIAFNRITGLGPTGAIAQNGIQIAAGANGRVQWNRVEQNIYTGSGAASVGILVLDAGSPLEIARNTVEDNDLGVRLVSTSDAEVAWNVVAGSTYDGIAIDGLQGVSEGNRVVRNRLSDNAIGIDLFGEGAIANEIIGNRIVDSSLAGIQAAFGATGNVLEDNVVRRSGVVDIENAGDNLYTGNRCSSSSGSPVDCP